ncbi:MAG: hypothetical protein L3J17_09520 [Candidatus Jettenia sp.]|nr:MAG: hypothetical protein L3J17_09520 [Candidatus Jettenia sp.]
MPSQTPINPDKVYSNTFNTYLAKYKIIVEAVENETLALEKIRNKKGNSYELPFLFTFIIKKNFTPTMQSGSVSWNTAIRYCPGQRNHLP